MNLGTGLLSLSSNEDNMLVNVICKQSFDKNWDPYDENEFNTEGELIYFSPLLGEVWPSELS